METSQVFPWTTPQSKPITLSVSHDDPLWIAICSATDVLSLIKQPYQWIETVNSKFDLKHQIVLPEYFSMQISMNDRFARCQELQRFQEDFVNPGDYVVQGISGTPVIIIRPNHQNLSTLARTNILPDGDDEKYWKEWEDDGQTTLNVARAEDQGQGFGHMQIAKAKTSTSDRAARIASFIFRGADPTLCQSHDGSMMPHINRVLKKTTTLRLVGSDVTQEGSPRQFSDLTGPQIMQTNFSFVGRKMDFDYNAQTDQVTQIAACDDKAGTIVSRGGMIQLTDVTVKGYDPVANPGP